jgi:hypothetical protein
MVGNFLRSGRRFVFSGGRDFDSSRDGAGIKRSKGISGRLFKKFGIVFINNRCIEFTALFLTDFTGSGIDQNGINGRWWLRRRRSDPVIEVPHRFCAFLNRMTVSLTDDYISTQSWFRSSVRHAEAQSWFHRCPERGLI